MRTPTTLLILTLLATAAFATTGNAEPETGTTHWILVDARTMEIHTGPPETIPDSLYSCGGQAPFDTYCETGEHPTVWIHGFAWPFPDAGTLESRLIHEDGAQVFRCDYLQGETVSCFVFGVPVGPEGPIHHDCYAYLPLTAGIFTNNPSPGEPTGIPGGLGPWQCLLVP